MKIGLVFIPEWVEYKNKIAHSYTVGVPQQNSEYNKISHTWVVQLNEYCVVESLSIFQ